ncbi:hypothetical protein GCM10009799_41150 [Nocardiopsis rhodophaea]|uniref:Uncharacterized protein n=1 Tax=Nocardiopsis rhodophaea TaxID=280238 RepID=A0ABP5EW23_9ACTN
MHDALVQTIGFPFNDRFQVLVSYDGTSGLPRYNNSLGVDRDDDIVYVVITMRSGRPRAEAGTQSARRRARSRVRGNRIVEHGRRHG